MRAKAEFASPYELTGSSTAVQDCLMQIDHAAVDDRGVLVSAERGLDTQAVARAIHRRSTRRSGPFVVVASGGGAAQLERELFGAQYRGAPAELEVISAASPLLAARGGVLFIENITELPTAVQRRLARVLRDGEARVPRRAAAQPVDVRLIGSAETSGTADLRDDLARRLPLLVNVPALRQRREDVPSIAQAMLAARDRDKQFTPAALTVLSALPWRRNTAELAGLIARLAAASNNLIRQEDVLAEVQLDPAPVRPAVNLRDARRQFERDYIASVLRDHEWQMRDAARALGIERANLYRKARQLGIPLRREPDTATPRASR